MAMSEMKKKKKRDNLHPDEIQWRNNKNENTLSNNMKLFCACVCDQFFFCFAFRHIESSYGIFVTTFAYTVYRTESSNCILNVGKNVWRKNLSNYRESIIVTFYQANIIYLQFTD